MKKQPKIIFSFQMKLVQNFFEGRAKKKISRNTRDIYAFCCLMPFRSAALPRYYQLLRFVALDIRRKVYASLSVRLWQQKAGKLHLRNLEGSFKFTVDIKPFLNLEKSDLKGLRN